MSGPHDTTTTPPVDGATADKYRCRRAVEGLTKRAEFLFVGRGRRQAMPGFVLQAARRLPAAQPDPQPIRAGFTCSKKVGNAVARNRAKRRLRALAQDVLPRHGHAGWDYVLIGRSGTTATRPYLDMRDELVSALERVHGRGAARR